MEASDAQALVAAAADGELWNLPYTIVPSAHTVQAYIDKALQGRAAGTVLPFVVVAHVTQTIVGSTRFWKIDRESRKLEIGHTWLSASWQGTGVNTESKFLMLRHAFEDLDCVRVQLTTDVLNERSRKAILRLGAVEEGVIRNERIMPDGRKRTSVRFSIIDDEWPEVRRRLEARLAVRSAACLTGRVSSNVRRRGIAVVCGPGKSGTPRTHLDRVPSWVDDSASARA